MEQLINTQPAFEMYNYYDNKISQFHNAGASEPGLQILNQKPLDIAHESYIQPYYRVNTYYGGGLRKLKAQFFECYNIHGEYDFCGYISFNFIVSANGRIGRIRSEEFNFKYEIAKPPAPIVKAIFKALLKLEDWIPGKDVHGMNVSSLKFLTFRIADGMIQDIMP
jgi:hypothetical protein